ncbi:MAG: SDR family NAD(P)-dependent oxidoreductase [Calditrichia bacterium]
MADKSSAAPTMLITGATEGIGYELSKIYAKEAYELVLVARNEERLKSRKRELEDEFGVPVAIIRMDLSEPGAAKKLFELTEKHEIVVDELINNAGYGLIGRFDKNFTGRPTQHDSTKYRRNDGAVPVVS